VRMEGREGMRDIVSVGWAWASKIGGRGGGILEVCESVWFIGLCVYACVGEVVKVLVLRFEKCMYFSRW
jgi:hypothetical protein